MAARPVSWCRISISGRARNGCAVSNSSSTTSPVSGSRWAITSMEIPGKSSAMQATEPVAAAPKEPAPKRLRWLTAEVRDVIEETPPVMSLVLRVPDWPGHRAGQHVDVRLTGEDGYQAQRSYSIASAPESSDIMLTVERIDDGEVSPYLATQVRPSDRFELRGPIGGTFLLSRPGRGPRRPLAAGAPNPAP